MALPAQIELLKVLVCMAWADQEFTQPEFNVIKRLMREFHLTGDEWMQVEMYLDEKVDAEEARRVIRRFLSRVRRPAERKRLVTTVEELLGSDQHVTPTEREWLQELHDAIAETSGTFLLDGLRSLLRIGASGSQTSGAGRESHLHDFIHNRVLFKLRHRVGAKKLANEGAPEKLKELTLWAACLGRVGYVDEKFLPQEKEFIKKELRKTWNVSPALADAVSEVAMEVASRGLDLHRIVQEVKAIMSINKRKALLAALFALAKAEGKTSTKEIEEIRKIAYGLDFTHREFINTKLRVLGGV